MIDVSADKLSSLIGDIYQSALEPAAWPDVMRSVRDLFGGTRSCMTRIGVTGGFYRAEMSEEIPADLQRLINDIAATPTLYLKRLQALTSGSIYTERTLVNPEWLRSSVLWNEWMLPLDMHDGLGIKVQQADRSLLFLAVHRGRRYDDFDARDVTLLETLTPHILRAVELNQNLAISIGALPVLAGIRIAALVVDADLRVCDINGPAEALLERAGSPLQISGGMLAATSRNRSNQLRKLVEDACSIRSDVIPGRGGDLVIPGSEDEGLALGWILSVTPAIGLNERALLAHGQALIFIHEMSLELPPDFDGALRSIFALSPAEAALAASLASGMSLKDAAVMRNIRFSTARSYLEAIFRKTGMRRQSQLVALLRSVPSLTARN